MALQQHRVLARGTIKTKKLWSLISHDGFRVSNVKSPHKNVELPGVVELATTNNSVVINNKDTHAQLLKLSPKNGTFSCAGKNYNGDVCVIARNNELIVMQYEEPQSYFNKANFDEGPAVTKKRSKKKIASPEKITSSERAAAYNVRVLLDEAAVGTKKIWHLMASEGFIIIDPRNPNDRYTSAESSMQIKEHNGFFYCNNKKMEHNQLYIMPEKGHIAFDGNHYQGGFLLVREKNSLYLINNLDLEEYVFCVLHAESWPGWPLEMNKVCAIASRTYAIAMVKRSKTSKLPYHIKNTNVHQMYNGVHGKEELKKAVEETQGVFLAYEGQPILAMFDCCCGGIIPAKIKGFDFSKAPYLARSYACTHCKPCKIFSWKSHFSHNNLLADLKPEFPYLKKIKSIKISKKDGAGLVQHVTIQGAKKSAHITGKKLYSLLRPKVKSFCFSIVQKGDAISMEGKGFGHHMGLCQWGGREMVRKGYGYRDVLQFYYPNTTFMRLS